MSDIQTIKSKISSHKQSLQILEAELKLLETASAIKPQTLHEKICREHGLEWDLADAITQTVKSCLPTRKIDGHDDVVCEAYAAGYNNCLRDVVSRLR